MSALGIIGLGLMGGSIAKAVHARAPHIEIVALLSGAEGLVRPVETLQELVESVDLLILAPPLSSIIEWAERIAQLKISRPLLVVDVGSVKSAIYTAFERLSTPELQFLPTHPMAGSERSGFEASRPDLFEGAAWVLTPHAKIERSSLEKMEHFIALLGAKRLYRTPQEHDRQAALISHLPYLIARDFLQFVQKEAPEALEMAGPGFRSFTRLAHSNPQMREEIAAYNGEWIAHSLEAWRRCT